MQESTDSGEHHLWTNEHVGILVQIEEPLGCGVTTPVAHVVMIARGITRTVVVVAVGGCPSKIERPSKWTRVPGDTKRSRERHVESQSREPSFTERANTLRAQQALA